MCDLVHDDKRIVCSVAWPLSWSGVCAARVNSSAADQANQASGEKQNDADDRNPDQPLYCEADDGDDEPDDKQYNDKNDHGLNLSRKAGRG